MPQLIRDDVILHYEVAGDGSKPWLFFSNSLGANLTMWDAQVDAFSSSFSVLRYDARGHGQSSIPASPCTIAQLAKDVLALAGHIGAERFHLGGLSMGGLIGQWLALHAPQRLGKLVLCDTAAKIGTAQGWAERIRIVEAGGMAAIVESGLQRWFTPRLFSSSPETIQHFRSMILATEPAGYIATCAALAEADFRSQLSTINIPTLVICATHDPVTTIADASFLVASIPGARIVELDAAHLSNVEQPGIFNQEVRRFLL
jgi:3-oxoadipate enol-lactonase